VARDRDLAGEKSDRALIEEIVGRLRRIETKTTIVANHLGLDAGETKPVFDREKRILWVKTPKTALEDIVAAIGDYSGPISVNCGDDYLATVGV
jgi:hypothetical protein